MRSFKKLRLLFLLILVINVTFACSKKDSSYAPMSESTNSSSSYYEADKVTSGSLNQFTDTEMDSIKETSTNSNSNSVASNRKLIRRIQMSIETLEFDKTLQFIMDEVDKLGGYSESSSINGSGYYNNQSRYASLTLRVPSNEVEQLLSLVDEKANILYKEETTEDITLSYVDTKSRVKSLEIQQARLLDLLEEADSLESIITLEQRLSEVRYEIEEYASRLRTYDNLVEYSTLTLEISEVNKITPIETKGILNRMGTGITKSLGNVYDGFINFIVWFVVNIPYLIIWSGIIVVTFMVYKKIKRVNKNHIHNKTEQLIDISKNKNEDKNK